MQEMLTYVGTNNDYIIVKNQEQSDMEFAKKDCSVYCENLKVENLSIIPLNYPIVFDQNFSNILQITSTKKF